MNCCKQPYWVAETGIAICRNCGTTKTIAQPPFVQQYPWTPTLPPYNPYPTYGNGTIWCDTSPYSNPIGGSTYGEIGTYNRF
jgi:hypothetical protein